MEATTTKPGCVPGTEIKKPDCELVGQDGNAFAIMARVKQALRRAGVPTSVQAEYTKRATSGDYSNLLAVSMEYVNETGMSKAEEEDEEATCEECGEELSQRRARLSDVCEDCEDEEDDS